MAAQQKLVAETTRRLHSWFLTLPPESRPRTKAKLGRAVQFASLFPVTVSVELVVRADPPAELPSFGGDVPRGAVPSDAPLETWLGFCAYRLAQHKKYVAARKGALAGTVAPSVKEVADLCRVRAHVAFALVADALAQKGWITINPDESISYHLEGLERNIDTTEPEVAVVVDGSGLQVNAPGQPAASGRPTTGISNDNSGWRNVDPLASFDDMELSDNVLRGVYAYGFETPSGIQQRAIVPIIRGATCLIQAPSGTGKTCAFCIAVVQRVNPEMKRTQAVVLCPSRELAEQTLRVIESLGEYHGVKCCLLVGGDSVQGSIRAAKARPHVAVGNAGRILDMQKRGSLVLSGAHTLVVDEIDTFETSTDVLYDIFRAFKATATVVFASTTPGAKAEEILRALKGWRVNLKYSGLLLQPEIKHFRLGLEEQHKLETLVDLYEALTVSACYVFVNTRRKVDWLVERLRQQEYTVASMHGDMCMQDRREAMRSVRTGSSRLIITPGTFVRGLDVQIISVVVNYDMPPTAEEYVHRSGRCGRYGRRGVVINFVSSADEPRLSETSRKYRLEIDPLPMNFVDLL
eukprot:TRINITY_DN40945_c0_g1_i1.p1 TRINITY_DN40945_c0_g1~~TRINITY_DN40945_c0_g1_i1.p1  ORF type:complete len:587 (+),score=89.54 TRINITY_DN40945_c0_g1_i1:30-1763(+)